MTIRLAIRVAAGNKGEVGLRLALNEESGLRPLKDAARIFGFLPRLSGSRGGPDLPGRRFDSYATGAPRICTGVN